MEGLEWPWLLGSGFAGESEKDGAMQRAGHQGQSPSVAKRRKTEVQRGAGVHSRLSPVWSLPSALSVHDCPSVLGLLGKGLKKGKTVGKEWV